MLTVRFPLPELLAAVRSAQGKLEEDKKNLMQSLGVQVLSFSQLAYREKARGGTGSDGITWRKLDRQTIEARVRSRAPAKRIVSQRRELARQIRSLKGKGVAAKKRRLIERRKELSKRLQELVDREYANHEIGVNTGLQRASAGPGYQGSDGRGGNVTHLEPGRVTVGYGREYSPYFDAARPLLPDELPQPWLQKLEQMTNQWAMKIANEELGKL